MLSKGGGMPLLLTPLQFAYANYFFQNKGRPIDKCKMRLYDISDG